VMRRPIRKHQLSKLHNKQQLPFLASSSFPAEAIELQSEGREREGGRKESDFWS
jgi:hypothetical protein